MHAHCIVPAALKLVNQPLEASGLLMDDTSTRIAAMDAQGIDVEALSINPYWYRAERDVATELIKSPERDIDRILRRQPGPLRRLRDRGLAISRSSPPSKSNTRSRTLGFRGVGVAGSVAGEELSNPRFHPFWAKCEELGVLVFHASSWNA